jgi:hypothetical protein
MTTKELIKKVVGWFKREPIDLKKIYHLKQHGLKPVFYNQGKSEEVLR